jgi:hypothetical protein
MGTTLPVFPLDCVRTRFHITEKIRGYRNHFFRGSSRTHSHLTPIEVDEVVDADQLKGHPLTAPWTHLIARRLVITHE